MEKIKGFEIISIIAIILSPIIAVGITTYIQNKESKRKDKMEIFKILMTGRLYGWDIASVHALNTLEIVFSDEKDVIKQWKNYYEAACSGTNIQIQQYKLLEEIAKSLGYKDKISWESIQNPYIPTWLSERMENERKYTEGQLSQAELAKEIIEALRNGTLSLEQLFPINRTSEFFGDLLKRNSNSKAE